MSDGHGARATLAETTGVTRRFGDFTAVRDASIAIAEGEIVGLIGANGAGKTTLIRMLLGLLPVTTGQVELFGQWPSRATRRRLGYVPQSLGLYAGLTVTENLRFSAQAFGSRPPEVLPQELHDVRDRLVGSIGLGLQRQLAFLAVLAHHPALLVLDEPTSGVDPLARAHLWDTIHAQAEQGVGVLVTTHYMQEASQCDRLAIMVAGRVAATGTAHTIEAGRTAVQVDADAWEHVFTTLSDTGMAVLLAGRTVRIPAATVADVRKVLDAAGLPAQISEVPASLEETLVTLAEATAERDALN